MMLGYDIYRWNPQTLQFDWMDYDSFPSAEAALKFAISAYGRTAAVALMEGE